jgi:hypothetical protein
LKEIGRVLNAVGRSLGPVATIFDNDLVERVDAIDVQLILQLVVDIDTLLEVLYVLGQLFHLCNPALLLDLLNEAFLHCDDLSGLKILRELNIFEQTGCHILLLLIDKSGFFLQYLEEVDELFVRLPHSLKASFGVADFKLIVDE